VVNASPLILFARVNRLALIELLAPAVLVPGAVVEEIRVGLPHDPTASAAVEWAVPHRVENVAVAASVEHWDLGPGEAQVITHAAGRPRWAVLDDRAARRCAAALGVPTIGSLGIVLRARQRGHITRARPVVQELVAAGMFLDNELIERVLATVGE